MGVFLLLLYTHTMFNNKSFFFVASVAPVTIEEHMLYTTLSAVLKISYKPLALVSQPGQLPPPLQRLFLEMTVRRIIQSPTDIMKRLLLLLL